MENELKANPNTAKTIVNFCTFKMTPVSKLTTVLASADLEAYIISFGWYNYLNCALWLFTRLSSTSRYITKHFGGIQGWPLLGLYMVIMAEIAINGGVKIYKSVQVNARILKGKVTFRWQQSTIISSLIVLNISQHWYLCPTQNESLLCSNLTDCWLKAAVVDAHFWLNSAQSTWR